MKCSSCDHAIPKSSVHCPYCGVVTYGERAPGALSPGTGGKKLASVGAVTKEITQKFPPASPQLPGKYARALRDGAAPEKLLVEVYEQKEKLWKLLKGAVKLLGIMAKGKKFNVNLVAELEFYMLHHCKICGEYVTVPEEGKPVLCDQCQG
jgi:hypothetical protein